MGSTSDAYFKNLLERYRANFDITEDYELGGKVYPAYAKFYSFGEKYVLKKEAKLWAIKAYEHVLFIRTESIDENLIEEIRRTITEQVEPVLVRGNAKYPEKDHMCSYMSFVIISDTTPDAGVLKAIKKFHFDKGYLFSFRGHSEAKIACACMDGETVVTNYAAKELKKLLTIVFKTLNRDKEEKAS